MKAIPGDVDVSWWPGHPERTDRHRTAWTEHDYAIYEVDKLAGQAYGKSAVRTEGLQLAVQPRWQVWHEGKPLRGRLRKRLMELGMSTRLWQYVQERQLSVMRAEQADAGRVRRSKGELWEAVTTRAMQLLDAEAVLTMLGDQKTVHARW